MGNASFTIDVLPKSYALLTQWPLKDVELIDKLIWWIDILSTLCEIGFE